MPTILEVCGAAPFSDWKGHAVPQSPGKSLVPVFHQTGALQHDELWWCHDGHKAVRVGDWKLVAPRGQPWELYDLKTDRAEQKDLAQQRAGQVSELAERWERTATEFRQLHE